MLRSGAQHRDPAWRSARDPARHTNHPQARHPHLPRRGSGQWVTLSTLPHTVHPPPSSRVWFLWSLFPVRQVRAASPLCSSLRRCRRSWRTSPWSTSTPRGRRRGPLPTPQGTPLYVCSSPWSNLDRFSQKWKQSSVAGLKTNLSQKYLIFPSPTSPSFPVSNTLLSEGLKKKIRPFVSLYALLIPSSSTLLQHSSSSVWLFLGAQEDFNAAIVTASPLWPLTPAGDSGKMKFILMASLQHEKQSIKKLSDSCNLQQLQMGSGEFSALQPSEHMLKTEMSVLQLPVSLHGHRSRDDPRRPAVFQVSKQNLLHHVSHYRHHQSMRRHTKFKKKHVSCLILSTAAAVLPLWLSVWDAIFYITLATLAEQHASSVPTLVLIKYQAASGLKNVWNAHLNEPALAWK